MPDPTAPITGHGGAVSIGATEGGAAAINGKLRKWELKLTGNLVTSKGAAIDWDLGAWIDADWEFTADVEFEDGTTIDPNAALLGADTYIAAKRDDDDLLPFFTHTGGLKEFSAEGPSDEAVTGNIAVVSTKGTAPTINTSGLTA